MIEAHHVDTAVIGDVIETVGTVTAVEPVTVSGEHLTKIEFDNTDVRYYDNDAVLEFVTEPYAD